MIIKLKSSYLFLVIIFMLCCFDIKAQNKTDTTAIINSIFPRGEKSTSNENFNGGIWLKRYISQNDSLDCIVSLVTFDAGVRTNWHIHPGGQILIVTEGTGYYQEKGKSRQVIYKGDIVKCTPGIEHWHGASPDGEFAHLVVAPDVEKGEVTWLGKVSDEEYKGLK